MKAYDRPYMVDITAATGQARVRRKVRIRVFSRIDVN